jgi:Recombination endonuclease VII
LLLQVLEHPPQRADPDLGRSDMRKGTHHTLETRLTIRLKRLEKSMPPDEFARFMASDGTLKWCPACKQLLPVGDFHKNRRAWDGLYDRCKQCNAAAAATGHRSRGEDPKYREWRRQRGAEWRATAKADGRAQQLNKKYSLKQLYGITLEEYDAILAAQRNCCAICRMRLTGSRAAHVDHDHDTGRVRGILCNNCNNGLGRFRDDPSVLRRAAHYLEDAASAPDPAPDAPVQGDLQGAA